jgi:predicted RND superfamily exporter protein
MNKTAITFGFALVLIVAFQSTNYVKAQTNFTKLFEEDPQYQLCIDYETLGPVCETNILNVLHETNDTMLASVINPTYMGPALDAIYDQGFKVEAIIPDTTQAEDFNTWIYFTK